MANTRKRKKRLNPVAKSMTFFVMIIISCVCAWNVFNELLLTKDLTKEIQASSEKQKALDEKKSGLLTQKDNLNDTEYLIRYARAKYLSTKEGEQVFKLPETETNE